MQTLDVISVNIWNILISLANLVLLFVIIKKFLYKPVKKVLKERRDQLEKQYSDANKAQIEAEDSRKQWEETLGMAKDQADEIIKAATDNAKMRGETIVNEAQIRADGIIRMAEQEAQLNRQKATEEIKREIIEVSQAISEKVLEREINTDDHKALIDSFIEGIGDSNE